MAPLGLAASLIAIWVLALALRKGAWSRRATCAAIWAVALALATHLVAMLVLTDVTFGEMRSGVLSAGFERNPWSTCSLRRAIQRDIEDVLSEKILFGEVKAGQKIMVDATSEDDLLGEFAFRADGAATEIPDDAEELIAGAAASGPDGATAS